MRGLGGNTSESVFAWMPESNVIWLIILMCWDTYELLALRLAADHVIEETHLPMQAAETTNLRAAPDTRRSACQVGFRPDVTPA